MVQQGLELEANEDPASGERRVRGVLDVDAAYDGSTHGARQLRAGAVGFRLAHVRHEDPPQHDDGRIYRLTGGYDAVQEDPVQHDRFPGDDTRLSGGDETVVAVGADADAGRGAADDPVTTAPR